MALQTQRSALVPLPPPLLLLLLLHLWVYRRQT
jgi:hypothetical protein